jgi:integrase
VTAKATVGTTAIKYHQLTGPANIRWLAGLRGLRRGELCGLRWSDIDLNRGVLTIERNRTTIGYQVVEGDPKTPAGRRAVALDRRSVEILRVHHRYEQDRHAEAAENGKPWTTSGYVFTRPDGKPINPNYATTRFRILVRRAGLPPVRLHDLRHGAASLAHEAGADLKTLQDLLGHSSIVVTADTYTGCRRSSAAAPTPPPSSSSTPPAAPAKRSRPRPARTGPTADRKQQRPPRRSLKQVLPPRQRESQG